MQVSHHIHDPIDHEVIVLGNLVTGIVREVGW